VGTPSVLVRGRKEAARATVNTETDIIANADTSTISHCQVAEPAIGIDVSHGAHRPQGVRRISMMDIDGEIMAQLFMQDEANATAERQQQMMMLANLLLLRQHLLTISVAVRGLGRCRTRTGSGKLAHYCLTLTTLRTTQNISQRIFDADLGFRVNKELFMKISMTHTSWARKTAPTCGGFHQFRSARLLCAVLHPELPQMQSVTIYAWPSRHASRLSTTFVGQWLQCLGLFI
jgi:hypothetical protein